MSKEKEPVPTNCPNCGTKLNAEEQELKECFSCGWPEWDRENNDETED